MKLDAQVVGNAGLCCWATSPLLPSEVVSSNLIAGSRGTLRAPCGGFAVLRGPRVDFAPTRPLQG